MALTSHVRIAPRKLCNDFRNTSVCPDKNIPYLSGFSPTSHPHFGSQYKTQFSLPHIAEVPTGGSELTYHTVPEEFDSSATEDLRKKAYEMVYPQKLPVLHKRDTEKNQKHGPQDHCYYQGHVLHEKDSAVSLSICDGLRGYIRKHDQRYLIEPLEHSDQGEHAIFKYEHKIQDISNGSCVVYNFSKREAITQGSRSSLSLEMQLYLKEKKYIELFIVADHALYRRHNHLQKWLRTRIFGMVNFVNMLYKTLNIQVILVGLEMWTNGDKIEVNSNLGTTLLYFGGWQETTLKKRKNFDHAQLLSYISAVPHCMLDVTNAYLWHQDHLHDTNMVADKMAHELAHSLGMQHDTYPCACTYGRCVMDGGGSIPSQGFSKCNRNQYRQYLLDYKPMCILNVPLSKDIITFPKCGNQILEVGEECDCGSLEDCTNVCCEANKCILKPGSACGGGECCEACKIKKAGILCRTAKDECDLPELCDGFSPKCPVDRFRVNGFPCQNSEGYCFMGKCPTRDSQCSEMFKDEAKGSHDICYERNKGGHKFGYCKKVDKRFIPCDDKDLKCGKIYCTGGQYFPSYGEDKTYHLKVPEQNITVECKAFFPFQYTEDLGMVASGTKCGDGKVCKNGECVNIETVYDSTNCSSHCPGNAVCDHELQCQCEEGLTHPNCDDTTFTTNVSIVAGVLTMVLATVVISVLFVHRQKASKQKQVHR
ncbi:disintegrin and metalloproteinase domain-containing protein 7 [Sarcophilus harrisii]